MPTGRFAGGRWLLAPLLALLLLPVQDLDTRAQLLPAGSQGLHFLVSSGQLLLGKILQPSGTARSA
jgi:hypothetical protein